MGEVTRAKKRRLNEEEREAFDDLNSCKKIRRLEEERTELVDDRISGLPDAVLDDIVSLLPSKDGARTQVLSSRWRPIWRSAALNFDFYNSPVRGPRTASEIGSILSSHHGPGRRFTIHMGYVRSKDSIAAPATLDAWLQCPALNNLQELKFCLTFRTGYTYTLPPFPTSVSRFSCTLRVASFGACSFPDGNASALHLPLLKQLSLVNVRISETSLHALLAGCSVLESLLLRETNGFPRLRIVSTSLKSIGVYSPWGPGDDRWLRQLIIEDAPCLERLLIFRNMEIDISVISAPRLKILGKLSSQFTRLQFGTTTFQGSSDVTLTTVVCSVKVLALDDVNLSLDAVINFIKCFPCLEKLYIQTADVGEKNTWYRKYWNVVGTLDIRLKKIVLSYYRGNKSHVNFAKFFVSNATLLESMRFKIEHGNVNSVWIERQHRLLQIEKRASRGAQFYFVSCNESAGPYYRRHAEQEQEQVHDLSKADPFERHRVNAHWVAFVTGHQTGKLRSSELEWKSQGSENEFVFVKLGNSANKDSCNFQFYSVDESWQMSYARCTIYKYSPDQK